MREQMNQKSQIKDYENLLAEFRATQNQNVVETRKQLEDQIWKLEGDLVDLKFGINQFKTMTRNQTHHFSELTKKQKTQESKIEDLIFLTEGL